MACVLDKLLEESEKLLMEVQDDNDLPHITRNLVQIQHMGERLCPSRGSGIEVKAARLFGPKMSYELPQKLSSKLETLVPANVYETVPRIPESDIQSFLKSERENALFSALLMTRKSMFEEVEERCEAYLQSWWEQVANGVLSSLSGSIAHADTDLENYSQPNSLDQRQTLNLTHDELIYSNQLDYYLSLHFTTSTDFTSFQNGIPRDLLTCLSMYQDSLSREKQTKLRMKTYQSDVTEMWCLVKRIAHCMRNEYGNMLSCDRPLETRASLSVQNSLSLCSLEHLEFEFLEFVKLTVADQPRLAQLGGRPGTRPLIRAYLSLRLSSKNLTNDPCQSFGQKDWEFDDGLVDEMPVWPMLFYCLRAGDKNVALEVAREALNNLGNFVSVLEDYVNNNRRLRTPNQARFRQISKQVVKSTRDPYKRLVYSILGNCDLSDNHSGVVSNIDDFLWIKISQVIAQVPEESTVTARSNADDILTLGQLQTLLYETYGEVHFDAWSQPFVYFKILFLTQQYEAALGFLSRFELFRCHAVHIALALKDLHMLLIPNSIQSSLVSCDDCDPKGVRRLNLVRLIMLYTRKFEVTEPEKALMYYYMLTDIPNTAEQSLEEESNTSIISGLHNMSFDRVTLKSQNLFVRCVCELALATKEPGAIDRFCKSIEFRKELLRTVARVFESNGQVIEAIHVFMVAASCGDPKPDVLVAVTLLNTLLSGVVVTSNLGSTLITQCRLRGEIDRSLVLRLATELANKVRRLGLSNNNNQFQSDAETNTWTTLFYLLDLATFFDLVDAERWQAAIDHIDQLSLFPSSSQPSQVESCVARFSQLPDLVRRPIPWALDALMRCFSAKTCRTSRKSNAASADWDSKMATPEIRARAKALIAFVGRIPHRLPSEIYAGLTRMDMEII